jgi:hypothetical protein
MNYIQIWCMAEDKEIGILLNWNAGILKPTIVGVGVISSLG